MAESAGAYSRNLPCQSNRIVGEDYGLTGQIQRAAVSIMSNIAEGFERGGRAEFHQFLSTAKGSCAEVRSQLYVAHDAGYLTPEEFDSLREQAEEVTRIVGGLRSAVERQRDAQRRPTVPVPVEAERIEPVPDSHDGIGEPQS